MMMAAATTSETGTRPRNRRFEGAGMKHRVHPIKATRCFTVAGTLVVVATLLASGRADAAAVWTIQSTPNPIVPTGGFSGVACTSTSACTAVGDYSASSNETHTLAERWNGTSWAIQATPNPSGAQGSGLSGVACASTSACTAVGHYTNNSGVIVTLAERWNGSSWAIQSAPHDSGAH